MTVRALIVDDEPWARRRLSRLLAMEPGVQLVAECGDGESAVAAVREHAPDVVFLDVKMPGVDGFEALRRMPPAPRRCVIFVTAFDDYAVRAFDVEAVDYLVKPVDPQRLRAALGRALDRLSVANWRDKSCEPTPCGDYPASVAIKTQGRVRLLPVQDIEWISAEGKHVRIHTARDTHLVRRPLRWFEARLDPRQFVRIHRSTLAGISRICEIEPTFHGDYCVTLTSGVSLPLSRVYRDAVAKALGTEF